MSERTDAFRHRSLRTLIVALCGGTALLVASIFTVLLISVVNLRHEDSSARRAGDLLVASSTAEQTVVDLETGLRGFVITQAPRFLSPYNQAKARLPQELKALRAQAESTSQRYQVDHIANSIAAYIRGYARPLIATGGHLTRAQALRVATQGKQLIDQLRLEFTALANSELALRDRRRRVADSKSSTAIVASAVGLGASVLLLMGLGIYLLVRLLGPTRTVAAAANRLAAGELDIRVPETGLGEVALLAGSFNAMAAQLQDHDRELTRAREQLETALGQAREASAAKSSFLANMSHEIRTPLNGVIGMMDLLSETELNAEQREFISVAKSSGEALMTVVNDVLDIAKIEAGRLELEYRNFDLRDLAEAACDMVAATSATKGLELQSFVHEDVPATVCGDRVRMGQILANLLSNAVKFTPEGEVVLEVSLIDGTDSRVEVKFEVRDTGIGIEPDRAEHLFEPFAQAEAGTTRAYGGTGLGLAIVRELTRMMNGRVELESEPGRGSTFTCVIPFDVSRRTRREPLPRELRGLNVLIVDDNATNRRIFEAYVASWGMRATVAEGAEAAMQKLKLADEQGDPFDVALLDFHMPGENGIDLAKRIRSARLATSVILLTSSGDISPRQLVIDHVLTKPVRQSRLLDAIGAVVSNEPSPSRQARPDRGGRRTGRSAASRRILVAEDQPVNWMLVERLLANRGHAAFNAVNGEEALQMLAAEHYDLVLMDCQMPLLDGYSAAREIRRRESTEGDEPLPIVAMTANAMEGDRDRCLAAGMDDYLAKPITTAALDEVLERWLPDPPHLTRLDPERISELRVTFPGSDGVEMVTQLDAEVSAQLQRLEAALGEGDGRAAAAAAHRLLSSARMIGAAELVAAATELQERARADDLDAAREAEARVRALWEAAATAVRAELLGHL